MLTRSVALQPDGPGNIEAMAALAEAQAGLGELEPAALHARRVLDRAPANATANLVVGLMMMEQKNYAAARDALQKAIAADPESPKAFYQLSLALARLGDEAGARHNVQIYQDRLRAVEERVNALRAGGTPAPEPPARHGFRDDVARACPDASWHCRLPRSRPSSRPARPRRWRNRQPRRRRSCCFATSRRTPASRFSTMPRPKRNTSSNP